MRLTKKFTAFVAAFGIIGFAGAAVAVPAYAAPNNCTGINCVTQGAETAETGSSKTNNLQSIIKLIVNIMLFLIGAISVIMIIVGGIKYTTSNGNAEMVKSAKNTITYAIVGLIVAIFAYAIVNFVIEQLT